MKREKPEEVFDTSYGDIQVRCPECAESDGTHIGKVEFFGPDQSNSDQGCVRIHIECESCSVHHIRGMADTGYVDIQGHEGIVFVKSGTWEGGR